MERTSSLRVRETFKVCLIIAVTAILTALSVPTAVEAASRLVKIEDADSTDVAQVDHGKVRIGDGVGSQNSLTIDGTVTARPEAVAEYRRFHTVASLGDCSMLATAPPNKAVVLQSLAFSMISNPSPGTMDHFVLYDTPDCLGGSDQIVTKIRPPGLGLIDVPLEPGIVSTTGFSIFPVGDVSADVHGVGYLIDDAEAPPD